MTKRALLGMTKRALLKSDGHHPRSHRLITVNCRLLR
jgi:hypothetical protein